MTPFHVGMKVVCVDDGLTSFRSTKGFYQGSLNGLVKGGIYTIRDLCLSSDVFQPNLQSCRVVEITRPTDPCSHVEGTYTLARFRPAHENRMDELRSLLVTPPSKAKTKKQVAA